MGATSVGSCSIGAALTNFGGYRAVRELGHGGNGRVYEAIHEVLRKRVAVKALRRSAVDDAVALQRFAREARAASCIRHPHVIGVHELALEGDPPYLVMDFVEGASLGEHLRAHGPLPVSELVAIVLPICSAVTAVHEAGIVHRDLKPSNVMLSRDRGGRVHPVVLDFGMARLERDEHDSALTVTGSMLGTLHYMPPEQLQAPRDADERSDQYALGAMIYQCATGRRPFSGSSPYELMRAIMTTPLASVVEVRPEFPAGFAAAIARAMSRDPNQRFKSVRELGRIILPFADAETAALWAPELQVQVATLAPHGGPAVDAGPLGKRTSWPSVTQPERRPGPPGPFPRWRLKHLWVSLTLAGLVGAALALAATPSTGRLPLGPPARGDEHAIAADRPPAGGRSLPAGSQAVLADIGETPALPTQKAQQSLPVADPPAPAVPPTDEGRAASTDGPSTGSAQPPRGLHPTDTAPSDEPGGTMPSVAKSEPTAVTTGPEAKRLKRLHSKRRVRFGNNRAPILE